MIHIPHPLTTEGPTSRQIGRKLAKLFATMRTLERSRPAPKAHFRNGMEALAKWEQEADTATDKF
jgi:hypothetical protein